MSLLYKREHLSCIHYQKQNPPIKIYKLGKGEVFENEAESDSLFFFLKSGRIEVSYNGFVDKLMNEHEILLIPTNCSFKAKILEDAHFITFAFDVQVQLCASFSMTQLYPYYKNSHPEFCVLQFNSQLHHYIELLELFIGDGVNCIHLYDIKKQELFYILRAYYKKDLLASFFYPVLDKEDIYFKKFILENCLSVKSITELARIANYSTSGFIKKFTRCFDASPYRWIVQYKADRILNDIHSSDKSFKEICDDYNFSSMPHFIEFCKKQYGSTPGKMRKRKEETIIESK